MDLSRGKLHICYIFVSFLILIVNKSSSENTEEGDNVSALWLVIHRDGPDLRCRTKEMFSLARFFSFTFPNHQNIWVLKYTIVYNENEWVYLLPNYSYYSHYIWGFTIETIVLLFALKKKPMNPSKECWKKINKFWFFFSSPQLKLRPLDWPLQSSPVTSMDGRLVTAGVWLPTETVTKPQQTINAISLPASLVISSLYGLSSCLSLSVDGLAKWKWREWTFGHFTSCLRWLTTSRWTIC